MSWGCASTRPIRPRRCLYTTTTRPAATSTTPPLASSPDSRCALAPPWRDRIEVVGMEADRPSTALQLRSLVKPEGTLEVSLETVTVPEPGPNQVVVRVEAAPLNPSDLGLLLAGAHIGTAAVSGPSDRPVLTATIPAAAMTALAGRLGLS